MTDEGTVPTSKEEVPGKIGEAFKVQELDASLAVVPPPTEVPDTNEERVITAFASEDDKLVAEKLRGKKQNRITKRKKGDAQIGLTRLVSWVIVGWTIFVAFYLVALGLSWLVLPTAAIVTLIGSAALPTVLKLLVDLLRPETK